ncbi:MAG TPA: hypothetical protein VFK47_06600, partial [Ktedonobacteraceae bacterium]|nr:hypothetical protein [Ktedonobacteraceae bacterium]
PYLPPPPYVVSVEEEVSAVAVGDGAELAVLVLFPQAANKASILISMKKNKVSVVGFLAFIFVFILFLP